MAAALEGLPDKLMTLIKELRSLPFPRGFDVDSVALGSDPNTGQYVVVMIRSTLIRSPLGVLQVQSASYSDREARLYDFSTDSWRDTAVTFPPGPFRYSHRAISLNGAFHWSPWDGDSNILTFHMSNEVTGSIPLPHFAVDCCDKELCVSTKSQLSLVLYDKKERRFEICVMTEYGVNESWTRLFQIGHLPLVFLRPITFWEKQRVLLFTDQGQLVSCGLQHQNILHFPIDADIDVFRYSQSLISVNEIGKSII